MSRTDIARKASVRNRLEPGRDGSRPGWRQMGGGGHRRPEAERRGIRTDDVMAEMEAQAAAARRRRERERERRAQRAERNAEELTRRGFLVGGATVGAAVALSTGGLPVRPAAAATTARIAIVGGGLAGIRCAHSLWTSNKKAAATIYEADTSHIGGRAGACATTSRTA